MKFSIHIGRNASLNWVWELSYEELRPHGGRPTTIRGLIPYASFDQAKRAAEDEARSISRRHDTQVNYVFEV